jgi:hypothetical protein
MDGLSLVRIRPGRGGARPGAGRPKGKRDSEPRFEPRTKRTFLEQFHEQIEGNADAIISAYLTACLAGDARVIVDLMNRLLGKPATAIELSGPGGHPVRLEAMTQAALAQLTSAELDALSALNAKLARMTAAGSVS